MGSIPIGKVLGIRLTVNVSWFFLFALVTFSLAAIYFPRQYPGWPAELAWLVGLTTSLLFFVCVVLHELAHSLVALRHQVPVRSITLFVFGGVSHLAREAPRPRVEFLIAAAGPAASLMLALLFGLAYAIVRGLSEPLAALALWLAVINAALALFNLLPGLPLDGGRVLRSLLWFAADDLRWATRIAARAGQAAALLLVSGGLFLVFLQEGGAISGGWLALIGWFMYLAAGSSYQASDLVEVLNRTSVRQVMAPDFDIVEADSPLAALALRYSVPENQGHLVVVQDGRRVGLIGPRQVQRTRSGRREQLHVWDAMLPFATAPEVALDAPAGEALQSMALAERAVDVAAVVEDGQMVGLLSRDDLLRAYEKMKHLK